MGNAQPRPGDCDEVNFSHRVWFILTLASLFLLGACGGGGGGGPSTPEPPPPTARPLTATPSTITMTGVLSQEDPTASFTVRNPGDLQNSYTITANDDWLSVSPTSGSLAGGAAASITVTASCDVEGTRTGTITVEGTAGANDSRTVTVNLTCNAPAIDIVVRRPPLAAEASVGSSASAQLEWEFRSPWDGQGPLDYTITSDNSNVASSPANGSASPGATVTNALTFSCTEDQQVSAGVIIGVGDDSATVAWEVTCAQGKNVSVEPTEITLSALIEEEVNADFTVKNDGSEVLTLSVDTNVAWLSSSHDELELAIGGSATVTLTVSCASLGESNGTVTVGDGEVAADVDVQITCSAPPITLEVTAEPDMVTAEIPDSASASVTWHFSSAWSGQGPLEYSVSSDQISLDIDPSSGTAAADEAVTNNLIIACSTPGAVTANIEIAVGDMMASATWEVVCEGDPATSVSLLIYQGPLAVTLRHHINLAGEWELVRDQNFRVIPDRETYLGVNIRHRSIAPPPIQVVLSGEEDIFLEDLVETRVVTPELGSSDPWATERVYRVGPEIVVEGMTVEIRIDADDLIDDDFEANSVLSIDFSEAEVGFALSRYAPMTITIVPIKTTVGEVEDVQVDEYLDVVRDLLPIRELIIEVRDTLDLSDEEGFDANRVLRAVEQTRVVEAERREFYHGIFKRQRGSGLCGIAYVPGYSAITAELGQGCDVSTFAHEFGHNLSLFHAPACNAGGADPGYPYDNGTIGEEFGWLMSERKFIGRPHVYFDVMSYCSTNFISQYSFNEAVKHWSGQSVFVGTSEAQVEEPAPVTDRFESGAALIISGVLNEFGEWSIAEVSRHRQPPTSLLRYRPTHFLELFDAQAGATIHRQPLEILNIDHTKERHWFARVPVPLDPHILVRIKNHEELTLYATKLAW